MYNNSDPHIRITYLIKKMGYLCYSTVFKGTPVLHVCRNKNGRFQTKVSSSCIIIALSYTIKKIHNNDGF